jgi:exonuclease SbcD
VDVVVHAGDVFDRSSIVSTLAWQAFEPLRRIAELGIPVLVVPGNHERSRLPHLRFARHPNLHVFDAPRTIAVEVNGTRIAFSGFPYERHDVRARFGDIVKETRWTEHDADARMLCVHHCVEGATVGPVNYTFTTAADVIRVRDVPADFAAVLSGHIHRHQVITADLVGRPIHTPVLYPGSIERTAVAEIGEAKGYMVVEVSAADVRPTVRWEFRELPARPMIRRELDAAALTPSDLARAVERVIAASPADAVLSVSVSGALEPEHWRALSAARLRALAPEMNVEVVPADRVAERRREPIAEAPPAQLALFPT